jgi:hypothetical protein
VLRAEGGRSRFVSRETAWPAGIWIPQGGYVRVLFHVKQTGRPASGYLNEASFNEATPGVEIHAFAGRNSLLAGNLAGNFKNLAGFAPFRPPRQVDRMTYQ